MTVRWNRSNTIIFRSGVSHWSNFFETEGKSPRDTIFHNIDPLKKSKGADNRKWVNKLAQKYSVDISLQAAVRYGNYKLLTGDPVWNVPDGNIQPPEAAESQDSTVEKKLRFEKRKLDYWIRHDLDVNFEPSKKLTQMIQLYNLHDDPGRSYDSYYMTHVYMAMLISYESYKLIL